MTAEPTQGRETPDYAERLVRLAPEYLAPTADEVARWFHEAYERMAPEHGYTTRKASAVPWEQVPEQNRALMTQVAAEVRDRLVSMALSVLAKALVNMAMASEDDSGAGVRRGR